MLAFRAKSSSLSLILLFALECFGQTPGGQDPERVFRIEHATSAREFQGIVRLIQHVLGGSGVLADSGKETLTVRGTADQLSIVEWLITELDHPVVQRPYSPSGKLPQSSEYHAPGGADGVVRVIYMTHIGSVYDLQEIATAFSAVAGARHVGTHNTLKALIVRGTTDQVALVGWLATEWDSPAYWQSSGERPWVEPLREYRMPDGSGELVRMFYLNSTANLRDLQEMHFMIRTMSDTTRVFAIPNPGVIVFRGAPRNVAMGEWLFNELNRLVNWHPTAGLREDWNVAEYLAPEYDNHVVRVFYLPETLDPTETVMLIRRRKWLPYTFICNRPRALIMRGTREDTELVERWIGELLGVGVAEAGR